MRNRSLKLYKTGIAFGIIAFIFTILLLLVDVQDIGPEGSRIGFAKLNGAVFNATGYNEMWYNISDILGKIDLLAVVIFACMGLVQLFKNKGLMKVDPRIRALGVFYVAVGIIYVLFTFIPVNYRPVIMGNEGLEPSYPSSHTLLACCVMASAVIMINELMEKGALQKLLKALCVILLVATVVARFMSGVHWLTDIIVGILISTALVFLFAGVIAHQKESSRGLKFYD